MQGHLIIGGLQSLMRPVDGMTTCDAPLPVSARRLPGLAARRPWLSCHPSLKPGQHRHLAHLVEDFVVGLRSTQY